MSCSQQKQPEISHLSAAFPQIIDCVNRADSLKVFWHASQWDTRVAAANEATSSGVCFARNAVFLAEPNINQTSTQDEVNGENLQQQKSMKVYIELFSRLEVVVFFFLLFLKTHFQKYMIDDWV